MGLLQKAKEQNLYTPETRNVQIDSILERLNGVKNKIEFYPIVFKELVNLLNIEKGAFLIQESDIFTLSSIIGYDITTLNRLRISYEEFQEFQKTKELEIIRKYFSIREFVTMNKVNIYPFHSNNDVKALLLISEYKTENQPSESEIISYISQIEHLINENPLNKLKSIKIHGNDIKESITNHLQKIKNSTNRVVFIKISMNNLIKQIKEMDNFAVNSNIINSAIKMLTSFTKDRGRVYQLYNNDILITLIDSNDSVNIMIVQQQISNAFKTIFSANLTLLDLNFETLIWKNNSLETILDHFIQDELN